MFEQVRLFARDVKGNVAITFSLSLLPLIFAVGAAVDYSNAGRLQSRLQVGTDVATLAVCKADSSATTADLRALAQKTTEGFVPGFPITLARFDITSSPRSVVVRATTNSATSFMKLATIKTVAVAAEATCSVGQTNYEVALVVDTTGSMDGSAGSTTKIQALRSAATDFVNYLFDNASSGQVKVSLVPFSATVKVDPTTLSTATWIDQAGMSKTHWSNINGAMAAGFRNRLDIFGKLKAAQSSWGWAGCFQSLPYPLNVQDTQVTPANPDSYFVPLLAPDEVGNALNLLQLPGNPGTNSYVDDGNLLGTCGRYAGTSAARMNQACKYNLTQSSTTSKPGPNWTCTSRALTRLTTSRSLLLSEISLLTTAGNTNVHEGLMWGWRTISPNSVFADGAAYNSATVVKTIVLMTDGQNAWTADSNNTLNGSEYSAYGYFTNADGTTASSTYFPPGVANPNSSAAARAAIDRLSAEACTAINATQKIAIYVVAFSSAAAPIDSAGQTLLSNCAGVSSRYFLASDSTSLTSAFKAIAQGIGQLRLTR